MSSAHSLAGGGIPRRDLQSWLDAMLAACPGHGRVTAGLTLLRDGDMARLNAEALGLPGPTNILSFPDDTPQGGAGGPAVHHLGELYLSLDTLEREARLYGQPRGVHARRLLAHGLAHLLGYEHGSEMEKAEATLLAPLRNMP